MTEAMTYVLRNNKSGNFWGFKRPVSEYPDAQKFNYKDAMAQRNKLEGHWFIIPISKFEN